MAITKKYTTAAKLAEFLNKDISLTDADFAINQAVNLIDENTGRNFIADTANVERNFDGVASQDLFIDDCISITTVKRGLDKYFDDYETISAGGLEGYYLKPLNYAVRGLPINQIHLRSKYWVEGWANCRITGKWGFSESPPEAIVFATTVLAAGIYMYNRGGSGAGSIKAERIGDYSVTYENDEGWEAFDRAMQAVATFRKINL